MNKLNRQIMIQKVIHILNKNKDSGVEMVNIDTLLKIIDIFKQEERTKQLTLTDVMPELLCINSKYTVGLTKGNKYKAMFENSLTWFLKDDDNEIWGYEKTHFDIVEAQ